MTLPNILIPLAAHNGQNPQVYGLNQAYAQAVSRAGGNPILVARPDDNTLVEMLSIADGILLAGGHDVDPSTYGEEKGEHTCNVDQDRDRVEMLLTRLAQEKNIPLLGICRGMQIMNITFGGSLYQHIAADLARALSHDMHEGHKRNFLAHEVVLTANSLLGNIVGTERIATNSLHHQGIKVLSDKLVASGHTSDGLVESVELREHPFCIGVQWHPEELHDEPSQRLFNAFIAATKIEA